MCCCNKSKFIGCYDCCGDTLNIPSAADYLIVHIKNGGTIIQVQGEANEGGGLDIELPELMVGYSYEITLYKTDHTQFVDADDYDCFYIDVVKIES